jgi:hypothetical protein
VTITLDDGTQLELAESSRLVIIIANRLNASGQRAETKVDLLEGLLHSLLRFAPGNAPNYEEVDTPNAVAAARGTNYDTDYTKGVARKENPGCLEFTDVTVFEGVVGVSNPTGTNKSEVRLTRGHKATVPCQAAAMTSAEGAAAGGISSAAIFVAILPPHSTNQSKRFALVRQHKQRSQFSGASTSETSK